MHGTADGDYLWQAVKRPLINIQMCAVSDMLLGSTIHLSEESHISCVVVVVVEVVVGMQANDISRVVAKFMSLLMMIIRLSLIDVALMIPRHHYERHNNR